MGIKLPPLPDRMKNLPVDKRGYPIPWFVKWVDGAPDFRVVDQEKLVLALRHGRCWVCGEPLGAFKAFVFGRLGAVTRLSGEPPTHRECGIFSATACPFLTHPKMKRNERDMPANTAPMPGKMLPHNPGVAAVWVTRSWEAKAAVGGGVLLAIGIPEEVLWFCEGRPATRQEVLESLEEGLPDLEAEARRQGPGAELALANNYAAVMTIVPAT